MKTAMPHGSFRIPSAKKEMSVLDKVLAGAAKDVSDNGNIHLRRRHWLEVQIDCSNRECNEYPNSAARFDQVLPGIFVIGQAAAAIDFSRKGVV